MKAGVYVSETKAVMQQKAKPVIKRRSACKGISCWNLRNGYDDLFWKTP